MEPLQQKMQELSLQLNVKEQEFYANDIEITGVPELNGEIVHSIVNRIATKIGATLDPTEVVDVFRAGPRRLAADSSSGPRLRPRPLVLRLARRDVRDRLLKAARGHRKLTTEGIVHTPPLSRPESPTTATAALARTDQRAESSPGLVYLYERLSSNNKRLFYIARQEKTRLKWKYAWTSNGQVLVKQDEKTPIYRINTDSDIERVFKIDSRTNNNV